MENYKDQIDAVTKGIGEKISILEKQIKDTVSNGVTRDEYQKTLESIRDLKDSVSVDGTTIGQYSKAMQEQVNEMEKRFTEKMNSYGISQKSTRELVKDGISANRDQYRKNRAVEFEIKAADDVLTTDSSAGAGIVSIASYREPGIAVAPWRKNPLFTIVPKQFVGEALNNISWREETARTDAAAIKAEADTLGKTHSTFVSYKEDFQKIGHYAAVSTEEFEDDEYINGWINDVLMNGVYRKLETQLKSGTGTNELNGLVTIAKAFAKPSSVNGWSEPDEWQAIKTAILQVANGNTSDTAKEGFMADYAIVNPATIFNIETLLNSENMLKYPGFSMNGLNRIGSVNCLQSRDFTGNDGLIGDFSRTKLYIKRNLKIEVSRDYLFGTDMVAIKATMRGALVTKLVDRYAFVSIDFDTALPALGIE